MMNLLDNREFIFNCPYNFTERFSGAADYFKPNDDLEPDPVRGLAMRRTNFIPDMINAELPLDNRRSPGYRRIEPNMAGNRFYFWSASTRPGAIRKRTSMHSTAVLICIKGKGYTYTWPARSAPTPWKDGKAGQDPAAGLRVGRHGVGGADERRLVPPAFRHQQGARCALSAWHGPNNHPRAQGRRARREDEPTSARST